MSARGDQRKLLRRIRAAGATVVPGRGSHRLVYVNGKLVTSIGNADGRSGDQAASVRALRQAGLRL